MKLFSNTMTTIENALNYSSTKQKVISQNIANVDTPNYKAKDVSFKSIYKDAVNSSLHANRTDYRHFEFKGGTSSAIINRKDVQYQHNGNSVDLDKEMSELATNQIYYNAMIERMNGKFSTLNNVIRGGK
ncbi:MULTISPECIES: flagellar basal body rod protein FlgB [unclassified Bacillus (in: firmicutes)]|uniref:flagellar basal body rod protein FlgB n=1 Tax=unclassified Bacillus (in: firmicutes) TaxID=185979 RepID=UPI0008E52F99|nr:MULTISPECIES: flagellar basal body rod protein FlgB [unclassified Bacillus (in: firmicutes)]SFA74149.1 flagellar basal-body rod protein FlgB [Bacillus sp. UNCCL13]SFQ64391.1 flagellar basal-body rod protein FlgB [Bacillus sp. cl95]